MSCNLSMQADKEIPPLDKGFLTQVSSTLTQGTGSISLPFTCTHTHMHTHAHAHTHARTHVYTHTRAHAHTHTRAHTHTHMHTHTHTHMHTHTQCMKYALNRIRSLNEFCVICDERHVLETGLLKVCS